MLGLFLCCINACVLPWPWLTRPPLVLQLDWHQSIVFLLCSGLRCRIGDMFSWSKIMSEIHLLIQFCREMQVRKETLSVLSLLWFRHLCRHSIHLLHLTAERQWEVYFPHSRPPPLSYCICLRTLGCPFHLFISLFFVLVLSMWLTLSPPAVQTQCRSTHWWRRDDGRVVFG